MLCRDILGRALHRARTPQAREPDRCDGGLPGQNGRRKIELKPVPDHRTVVAAAGNWSCHSMDSVAAGARTLTRCLASFMSICPSCQSVARALLVSSGKS